MRKIGSTQSSVHSELLILSNIIFCWFKVALKISTKLGKDNWILIGNSIVANESHQGKEWSIIFSWGQRTRLYAAGKQISAKKSLTFLSSMRDTTHRSWFGFEGVEDFSICEDHMKIACILGFKGCTGSSNATVIWVSTYLRPETSLKKWLQVLRFKFRPPLAGK